LVDGLIQLESLHHLLNRSDATRGDGPRAIGNLIVNVGCGDDWAGDDWALVATVGSVQSSLNAALACGQFSSYVRVHSKPSVALGNGIVLHPHETPEMPKVFEFFCAPGKIANPATLV
jgi:hypothetical protein